MSRCVSFPPYGYTWNGMSGRVLIDFFKDRREKAEAKERRSWKKRKMRRLKDEEKKIKLFEMIESMEERAFQNNIVLECSTNLDGTNKDLCHILPRLENVDDQDWFFQKKHPPKSDGPSEKSEPKNELRVGGSNGSYPSAQYLHQVDTYALPYTIPF